MRSHNFARSFHLSCHVRNVSVSQSAKFRRHKYFLKLVRSSATYFERAQRSSSSTQHSYRVKLSFSWFAVLVIQIGHHRLEPRIGHQINLQSIPRLTTRRPFDATHALVPFKSAIDYKLGTALWTLTRVDQKAHALSRARPIAASCHLQACCKFAQLC